MDGMTGKMKAWAWLLGAVTPLWLGWMWTDCEICAWMALECAAGALGVGVWIVCAERF